MSKIENLGQLQAEIKRLRTLKKLKEIQIKNDLLEIREDLKPKNIFLNALSSVSGIKINKKEFFQDGIAKGISVLIQRVILRMENKIESKIYDFVDTALDKVKNLVNKFAGHDAKRSERREN